MNILFTKKTTPMLFFLSGVFFLGAGIFAATGKNRENKGFADDLGGEGAEIIELFKHLVGLFVQIVSQTVQILGLSVQIIDQSLQIFGLRMQIPGLHCKF